MASCSLDEKRVIHNIINNFVDRVLSSNNWEDLSQEEKKEIERQFLHKILPYIENRYKGKDIDVIDVIADYLSIENQSYYYDHLINDFDIIDVESEGSHPLSFISDYNKEKVKEHIQNLTKTVDIAGLERSSGSKLDPLDRSVSDDKKRLQLQFLNNYFNGSANTSRKFLITEFGIKAAKKLFNKIGKIEDQEITEILNAWKRDLLKEFTQNLKIWRDLDKVPKWSAHQISTNYKIEELIKGIISDGSIEIERLPILINDSTNEKEKAALKTLQSYLYIKEFNNFINYIFDGVISVQRNSKAGSTTLEDQYHIILGDKNQKGWENREGDQDETEFLGSLPSIYLQSLNIYDENGEIDERKHLSFGNVKVAVGAIMALQYEKDALKNYKISGKGDYFKNKALLRFYYNGERSSQFEELKSSLEGKSIDTLIAFTKTNPDYYMPLLLSILHDAVKNGKINIKKGSIQAQTIHTLYYSIVGESIGEEEKDENGEVIKTDSLLDTLGKGDDLSDSNIYSMVAGMLVNIEPTTFIEYQQSDEGIKTVRLKEKGQDTNRRKMVSEINTKYRADNVYSPESYTISSPFQEKIKSNENLNPKERITIEVTVGDITLTYGKDSSGNEIKKIGIGKDTTSDINKFLNTGNNLQKLVPFITEVFDIPFDLGNGDILRLYKGSYGDLFTLALKILYKNQINKYVTYKLKTDPNAEGHSKWFLEQAKDFLPSSDKKGKVKLLSYADILTLEMIGDEDFPTTVDLSEAYDTAMGYSQDNIAYDGERKALSTLSLPTLDAQTCSIWRSHNLQETTPEDQRIDSPLTNMSIYNLMHGIEYIRDFSSAGIKKQGTSFTSMELFRSSFIEDYYGQLVEYDENGIAISDTNRKVDKSVLRVTGPVASDKPKPMKIVCNWLDRVVGNDGKEKFLKNLTIDEIQTKIKKEFGDYYEKVYKYILSQWNKLNVLNTPEFAEYLRRKYNLKYSVQMDSFGKIKVFERADGVIIPKFNYNNNFREINEFCKQNNINVQDLIYEFILQAQSKGEEVEIIDQVMYQNLKGGGIGNNASLFHQLHIFDRLENKDEIIFNGYESEERRNQILETFGHYLQRKKNQLIVDLMNIQGYDYITLSGDGNAKKTARNKNEGWLTNDIDKNLIIAKVKSGVGEDESTSLRITNKQSFKDWYWYKKFKEETQRRYGRRNFPPEFNIDRPEFDLEKTLSVLSYFRRTYFTKEAYRKQMLDNISSEQLGINDTYINSRLEGFKGNSRYIGDFYIGNQLDLQGQKRVLCGYIYQTYLKEISEEDVEKREEAIEKRKEQVRNKYEEILTWDDEKIDSYIKSYEYNNTVDDPLADLKEIIPNTFYGLKFDTSNLQGLLESYDGVNKNSLEQIIKSITDLDPQSEDYIAKIKNIIKEVKLISDNLRSEAVKARDAKNYSKEGNINDIIKNLYNLSSFFKDKLSYNDDFSVEINPEVQKHNTLDLWLSQEYMLTTVGSFIAQPGKGDNIHQVEAIQYGQSVKRNVIYTASIHREVTNRLNGIPEYLNFAVIDDPHNLIHTYNGEEGKTTPYDGASWCSAFMCYLDNNSLGADAMGTDKKPFAAHQGVASGIGEIWKTAVFAITNQRLKMSNENGLDRNLHKKMNSIAWSEMEGYQDWYGWTKDWNGNDITKNIEVTFEDKDGSIKRRYNFKLSADKSTVTFDEADVLPNGNLSNPVKGIPVQVNNNYQLWELFGGYNSGNFVNGKFEYDESSIKNVVYIMNHTGVKTCDENERVISQGQVNQIMKKAMVHIAATAGAVKFGGININSEKAFYDPDYKLIYSKMRAYNFGEQLDAEHTASDGHVSLMTQVVNALGARGYSWEDAMECYNILRTIAVNGSKEIRDGLNKLQMKNPDELQKAILFIMYKALTKIKEDDGSILSALANGLMDIAKGEFSIEDFSKQFPVSHPAVFNKMVSEVASYLEKASVRIKAEGNQLVLNPSDRRIQIIGNQTAGYYADNPEELYNLQKKLDLGANRVTIGDLNPGYNYKIAIVDPETRMVTEFKSLKDFGIDRIDNPQGFYMLLDLVNQGYEIHQQVTTEVNEISKGNYGKPLGRELASYNCKFYSVDGREFNLWELQSVRELVRAQQEKRKEDVPKLKTLLQKDLDAVTDGINKNVRIVRNGEVQTIRVDQKRTEVQNYECIFPKGFFNLDIDQSDTLYSILSNPFYFVERLFKSVISNLAYSLPEIYEIELKSQDGKNIYLGNTNRVNLSEVPEDHFSKVPIQVDWEGDIAYRVVDGVRTNIKIPYTRESGKVKYSVAIYRDSQGFEYYYGEDKDLQYLIDNLHYDLIVADSWKGDSESLEKFLKQCKSKKAKECIKADFNKDYNNDIETFLNDIEEAIEKKETIEDFINRNPISYGSSSFRLALQKGEEMMTSFEAMLEAVVSRTPAQSQQSFMAMKVAALSDEPTNSAYVSRMQLFLQGSDYDIDKVSVLGLKHKNGKLITWSKYFNLRSKEKFNASKRLPFPTLKELRVEPKPTTRPYQAYLNNLNVIKRDNEYYFDCGESTAIGFRKEIIGDKVEWRAFIKPGTDINNLSGYFLIRNAIEYLQNEDDGLQEGEEVKFINFDTDYVNQDYLKSLGFYNPRKIKEGIKGTFSPEKHLDISKDFDIFNELIVRNLNIDYSKIERKSDEEIAEVLESLLQRNIEQFSDVLTMALKVYNNIGYISGSNDSYARKLIKIIIDHHNVDTFKGSNDIKDAALNALSIKMKDISKSPKNLIQAQSGIDVEADKLKGVTRKERFNKLEKASHSRDIGNVTSRMQSFEDTQTGKTTVGVVASAMKVFEAISEYYYSILEHGSKEEQERLLADKTICGLPIKLIANSYTRNINTIKSKDVREAYKRVNNEIDAFLTLSALLSLATDNAKDPALSKLNAGMAMMGLYTTGTSLGIPVEAIAELALSETGLLLAKLTNGNAFNGDQGQKSVTNAIKWLERCPQMNALLENDAFKNLLSSIGFDIYKDKKEGDENKKDEISKTKVNEIFTNPSYRNILRNILKALLNPHEGSLIFRTDDRSLVYNLRDIVKGSPEYYLYKRKQTENEEEIKGLENKGELTKDEQERLNKLHEYRQAFDDKQKELELYEKALQDNDFSILYESNLGATFRELKNKNSNLERKEIKQLQWTPYLRKEIQTLIKWFDCRDITDHDFTDKKYSADGKAHNILREIKKIDEFGQEMAAIRGILKLNQGLPNSLEDQMKFISNFASIINNRLNNVNGISDETKNLIDILTKANEYLISQGISNFSGTQVSLYAFTSNIPVVIEGENGERVTYNYADIVKSLYNTIKFAVNVFDVVDGVPHYKGYLEEVTDLTKGLETTSAMYRGIQYISDVIVPTMGVNSADMGKQISKNARAFVTKRMNDNFLINSNIVYTIPAFDIIDGKMVQKEGTDETISIRLGTRKGNETFKMWIDQIVIPTLKNLHPENKFLQNISHVSWQFTEDHNSIINWGKKRRFSRKNQDDMIEFDSIKSSMEELEFNYRHKGILEALFYYNLIAFNYAPGDASLTDLFEDLTVSGRLDTISRYNNYVAELDQDYEVSEQNQSLFSLDEKGIESIKIAVAPLIRKYITKDTKAEYVWFQRPDTQEIVLLQKVQEQQRNFTDYEDELYQEAMYDNMDYDGMGEELDEEGEMSGYINQDPKARTDEMITNALYKVVANPFKSGTAYDPEQKKLEAFSVISEEGKGITTVNVNKDLQVISNKETSTGNPSWSKNSTVIRYKGQEYSIKSLLREKETVSSVLPPGWDRGNQNALEITIKNIIQRIEGTDPTNTKC